MPPVCSPSAKGIDHQSQKKLGRSGEDKSRRVESAGLVADGVGGDQVPILPLACYVVTDLLLNSLGLHFLICNMGRVAIKDMRIKLLRSLSRDLPVGREDRGGGQVEHSGRGATCTLNGIMKSSGSPKTGS